KICGHTLPDFVTRHGGCLEAGKEIRAEKLEMFAIKRLKLLLRHFCAECQLEIGERHRPAFSQNSEHHFAVDLSDDESAVEREKSDQAFAQTQSDVGTVMPNAKC